jgi:hypothetical protein
MPGVGLLRAAANGLTRPRPLLRDLTVPKGWGVRCDPGPPCPSCRSPTARLARNRRHLRSRFGWAGSLDGRMLSRSVRNLSVKRSADVTIVWSRHDYCMDMWREWVLACLRMTCTWRADDWTVIILVVDAESADARDCFHALRTGVKGA